MRLKLLLMQLPKLILFGYRNFLNKITFPTYWLLRKFPFYRKLPLLAQRGVASLLTLLILLSSAWSYFYLLPNKIDAAWFDDSWSYRQRIDITGGSSAVTDYQVSFDLDTNTIYDAGKLQSDCDDIRVTDINGKLLPYWIESEATACGDSQSAQTIWVKAPTVPTSGVALYVYYGNPSATNAQNAERVFEFFDDFSLATINAAKWTTGTIGSTSGTDWAISAGTLTGGNANRYIQSVGTFTGDYEVRVRSQTTTDNVNGFTVAGFWASTTNNFGILDHNNTSYYRNDSSWVNFTFDGTAQWSRNNAKVVGTTATYTRTGETSGSATATSITNSGISAEYVRIGPRYDSSATDQNYVASWDWVLVKKAITTEPSAASPTNEEKAASPVGYWKFDEGTDNTCIGGSNDICNSGSAKTDLDGTRVASSTWATEDQSLAGKSLKTDGSGRGNVASNTKFQETSNFSMNVWVRQAKFSTAGWPEIFAHSNTHIGYGFRSSKDSGTMYFEWGTGACGGATWSSKTLASSVTDNRWHMLTATHDGSTLKLYYDGVYLPSLDTSIASFCSSSGLAMYFANTLYGSVDEAKYYNFALTAAQIKANYTSRAGESANVLGASDANENLSNGLVGYWKMDEASWTVDCSTASVLDASGNANNGKSCPNSTGPAGGASGKFGNSGSFNGATVRQGIEVANSTPLNPTTGGLTLSAWINTSQTGAVKRIITKRGSSTTWYSLYVSSNYLNFELAAPHPTNYSSSSGATVVNDGSWHHVAMVRDPSQSKVFLYVDGKQDYSGTDATAGLSITNSEILEIAKWSTETYDSGSYTGKIDEARVYNRALSPAEVSQLYNFAPGPIAYWDFNDNTGTAPKDISGSAYTLAMTNSPTWSTGKYGSSLDFDNDDYVSLDWTDFSLVNQTIEFWMNAESLQSAWGDLVGTKNNTDSNRFHLHTDNTIIWYDPIGVGAGSSLDSNFTPTVGRWHHVAGTYDGTTLKIYVDGVLKNSSAISATSFSATGVFIGGTSEDYNGKLDDVKIYNYARSAKQVVEDMNAGHPSVGSPVGSAITHWRFDEGYGTTANNSGSGGSTYNGTLVSSPTWTQAGKFGKALSFSETDGDRVSGTAGFGAAAGTVSLWFKQTTTKGSAAYVFAHTSGANVNRVYISNGGSGDTYECFLRDGTQIGSSYTITNNQWYHVACGWDGTSAKYYINGVQQGSTTTIPAFDSIGTMYAGAFTDGTQDLVGDVDEVKTYNYALTADEVKLDMNRGQAQVLGSLSDNSSYEKNSANQEYCIPGDSTSCAAPIASYDFEEGTGTSVNDKSGNGNTGTWAGTGSATRWSVGKLGKAGGYAQTASDDLVSIPSNSSYLNKAFSAITAEAWVYPTVFTAGSFGPTVISNTDGSGWAMRVNDGYLFVDFRLSGGNVTSSFSDRQLTLNAWNHIAITYSSSSGVISGYLNGALLSTKSGSGTMNQTGSCTFIGNEPATCSNTGGEFIFTGRIDQVRVFDYARTAAQIAWDYNKGGPIGWWKLDECQGTTANDSSGNGETGTITIGGSGTYTAAGSCPVSSASSAWYNGRTGKRNYSLAFDGTDDYINAGQVLATDNTKPFTLAAWANSDSAGAWRTIIGTGTSFAQIAFASDNTIRFGQNAGGGWWITGPSSSTDTWYHIVGVYDGANAYLYVDGVLRAGPTAQTFDAAHGTTYIGQYGGGEYMNGQVDDARIYNYALTATQVKSLMNDGALRYGPSTGAP